MSTGEKQVPLIERLRRVPKPARLSIDSDEGKCTSFYAVGVMCHEAADALSEQVEDAFEQGRQQGMKQERALWQLSVSTQEIEAVVNQSLTTQGADAVVDEAQRALHKRLIVLGAAIVAQRTWGEPLKIDESESQDNALADLAVEARKIADALAAISRPAGRGWISVEDRMPEAGAECLVFGSSAWAKAPYARIDTWDEQHEQPLSWSSATIPIGMGWGDAEFDEITHWQPLPEPPTAHGIRGGGGESPTL